MPSSIQNVRTTAMVEAGSATVRRVLVPKINPMRYVPCINQLSNWRQLLLVVALITLPTILRRQRQISSPFASGNVDSNKSCDESKFTRRLARAGMMSPEANSGACTTQCRDASNATCASAALALCVPVRYFTKYVPRMSVYRS